jgi:hypothetical protein
MADCTAEGTTLVVKNGGVYACSRAAGAILASSDSTALEKRHHSPLLQENK